LALLCVRRRTDEDYRAHRENVSCLPKLEASDRQRLFGVATGIGRHHQSTFAVRLGSEAFDRGDYPTALCELTAAIALNPENQHAYAWRGRTYAEQQDLQKALADYERAAELDPDDPVGRWDRGIGVSPCTRPGGWMTRLPPTLTPWRWSQRVPASTACAGWQDKRSSSGNKRRPISPR
jgi:tetratricopeptide (TPR) repeat protein